MRRYLLSLSSALVFGTSFVGFSTEGLGQIWTGLGDGETWLDGSNWDAGIAPQVPGNSAFFDANFGIPQVPIQMDGAIAISSLDLLNAPGDVVIADDEPLHPFLAFELDNGGAAVPIKLDAAPGYSLTFAESLSSLQFNDDVEVDHQGSAGDVFRIASRVLGSKSLTFLPGSGRAELIGSFFQLDGLTTDIDTKLGDFGFLATQDVFSLSGDLTIGPAGRAEVAAFVQTPGNLVNDGFLLVEPESFVSVGDLVGTGPIDVFDFATLRANNGAGLYSGGVQVFGGTLSVGSPFGGPPGQVTLHHFATIGTTSPLYNPTLDPAVTVDPSIVNPGETGLAIDNVPGYSLPIDLNFNNGVPNSYRLGSPSLASIAAGTPVVPFDTGGGFPAYFMGGTGRLEIDTMLTDSTISGASTAFFMLRTLQFPFGLNTGSIVLNNINTFTGPVLVEQEQLWLEHPQAVGSATALDIVATNSQYQGGNYQHGTLVLNPAFIGAYAGSRPQLFGGALGFSTPHVISFLPTLTGSLGNTTFDASGFDGGSPMSNLFALGGTNVITQDPTFVIDDGLDPNGNPVVLITTDQAFVELTRPNLHSGGTAVVGRSILQISDSNQLGTGPLNISDQATLRITSSTNILNNIDLHDTFQFANAGIEVLSGQSVIFEGNMSTADAPQGTLTKQGAGRLEFNPLLPWSPLGQENLWGLRIAQGDVQLHQLPEYEPGPFNWQMGPLVFTGLTTSLDVSSAAIGNATNFDNAGFRVLRASPGTTTKLSVDTNTDLKIAGASDPNEIYGRVDKVGRGTLWLGGDSSGGDAHGSRYDGRGDLNIMEGAVRIGNLPGTDDAARAFPDDIILRIQNNATLIKEQDQPGRVHSLFVNDQSGPGVAEVILFGGFSPLGDGSLNVELDANGTFDITGVLLKLGNAPLRFSAQPGATVNISGGIQIDDGTVEVDGSGIDPFTDTVGGNSIAVTNNVITGGLRITAGTVSVQNLSGLGRTRVDTGAKLEILTPFQVQNIFEVNGEIQAPILLVNELMTGRGVVTGDVTFLNGAIAPNDNVNPGTPTPAALKITGSLNMGLGNELNIDVDGTSFTNDFVDIGGNANLSGALTIDVHTPFNSLGTSSHVILSAGGGIPSLFSTVPAPGDYLGSGVEFLGITYGPNDITVDLLQTAYADFDGDLDVDIADYIAWSFNYGSVGVSHAQGDADLDGDVDGNDFLIWQRQVGTVFSLNPSITPSNVPEPSAIGLLVITFILCSEGRRGGPRERSKEGHLPCQLRS
ncbi:hypothetical protein [Bythopirellula goksoeyrii]|uniref:Autotransporter-associated beta strand repeat protein n=1 Tax=Bythopirellula goksoeyrii TaxID=1400387 RepID=A0A5B9QH89_9BACT|nr:hypothetical protein [Bythopirellula goksoeyrii]QEG33553.1 hypothetical protein Pr1d_08170 [Bythopirellula goksoeyrii]